MGVIATLVLAACYRRLTWDSMRLALISTMKTTCMMLLVIVGSAGFSQILAATGASSSMVDAVTELDFSPIMMVIIMQVLVLAMGCFIDTISIMMVSIPVFMPLILILGLDPIWFSILILVQLELAGITPPFGVLLFVMKGVQPHLSMAKIYRAADPIVAIQMVLVALLMIFPEIVSIVPKAMER